MKASAPKPAAPPAPEWQRWAGLLARLAVGGVLCVAGALKAAGPVEEFAHVIENYGFLSPETSMSAAAFLPWLELFAGFALMTGYFTRGAAAACAALFAGFLAALGSALARGIPLSNCGCFGAGFHPKPSQTLAMDIVLLGLCAAAYLWGETAPGLDAWASRASRPGPKAQA